MKKQIKIILLIVFIALVSVVGFCAYKYLNQDTNNENITPPSNTSNLNPLTGLPINKDSKNKRPIAIMINNLHSGQPLVGVSDADIMYECPTEGGITRILSVFKDPSNVTSIGSVRSARPYFISIAKSLDAIYVHLGGSTLAYNILKSNYIDSIDLISNGKYMWRDQDRLKNLGLEHSALTSGELLNKAIESKGFNTQISNDYIYTQKFNDNSQINQGTSANEVTAVFSGYKSTTFTYDKQGQTYLISQFQKPQMDDNKKVQNSKQNIILMNIEGKNIDNTELLELNIIGKGTGKYISHGKCIDITWSRDKDTSPFKYYTTDGSELIMLPGQTYVCLLAQWTSIKIN